MGKGRDSAEKRMNTHQRPHGFRLRPSRRVQQLFGLGLMLFSVVGLVLSLAGLVAAGRFSAQVGAQIDETLRLSLTALETTDQTLILVDDMLGEAADGMGSLQSSTNSIQLTVADTNSMLDSLHGTLDRDLPRVVSSTQQALAAAEESTGVIESVLFNLNSVSFLTGTRYEPDVTLQESISDVGASLDGLPGTYQQMANELATVQDDMHNVRTTLDGVGASLGAIESTLRNTQPSIRSYGVLVNQVTASVTELQQQVARWLSVLRLGSVILLVWLALTQIGLLFQGWEMLSFDRSGLEERVQWLEESVNDRLKRGEEAVEEVSPGEATETTLE